MNNEELGRLAVACIIAVLGALVEAQFEFCPSPENEKQVPFREAVLWWLLMITGCGVILDATKGSRKLILLLASAIIATVFLGAAIFMSFVDTTNQFCFSGISETHPAYVPLLGFIWLFTAIGSFLLSFSRPLIVKIVMFASHIETPTRIVTIEKTIRALTSALIALLFLFQIF